MRIGIDLGGSAVKIGAVDENYNIVKRVTVPINDEKGFKRVMDLIDGGVHELLEGMETPVSVGIGVPSAIKNKRIAVHTPNLDWYDVDVAAEMNRRFDFPCVVANDADSAALGEHLAGAGKNMNTMVLLTLGSGVGGSVVFNGKVLLGKDDVGVEPGHMKVQIGGELCGCGGHGCLEAYASATALKREIRRAVAGERETILKKWILEEGVEIGAKPVFDAVRAGDAVGTEIFNQYIYYLAAGVSTCILCYRPDAIVIGGGISRAWDLIGDALNAKVKELTYGADILGCPPCIPAILGNDAGIIGAAYME